jgi:hypothetical protein
MAAVTVFVDDAVRGTLPGVCAKDGVTTSSGGGRREVLTVQVPLSEPAYERLRTARRRQTLWLAVAVGSVITVLVLLVTAGGTDLLDQVALLVAGGLAVAGVVGLITNDIRLRRARIVVDLDASRRWVTLSDVHPAFVAACQAHEQRQGQRA